MKPQFRLPERDDFEAYQPDGHAIAASPYAVDEAAEDLSPLALRWSWACRLIAAGILLETLYFKFTGHPESVWIFRTMNMEAWGRYGQGIWELAASVLLLIPRTAWLGGLLTMAAMGAAILSHIAVLGIAVRGDHGLLFGMACTTFLAAFLTTWIHQQSIPNIVRLDE